MNDKKLVGLLKWLADNKKAALESIAIEDGKSFEERQIGRIISQRERYLILDEVSAIVEIDNAKDLLRFCEKFAKAGDQIVEGERNAEDFEDLICKFAEWWKSDLGRSVECQRGEE